MADLLQAFIAFITDLFAAIAEFLGGNSALGDIVDGMDQIGGVVDDLTKEEE